MQSWISVECDDAEFARRWVRLDIQKRLHLLLCSLRLNSGMSDYDIWGTYTAVNSLIDLLVAWMICRAFLNSLASLELGASADAFSEKLDSCECRKMRCSHPWEFQPLGCVGKMTLYQESLSLLAIFNPTFLGYVSKMTSYHKDLSVLAVVNMSCLLSVARSAISWKPSQKNISWHSALVMSAEWCKWKTSTPGNH